MNSYIAQTLKVCLSISLCLNLGFANSVEGAEIRCEHIFFDQSAKGVTAWGLKFLYDHNVVIRDLNSTTIGVEVEGSIPREFSRKDVAHKISEILALNPNYKNIRIKDKSYSSFSVFHINYHYKGHEYRYVVTKDSSINPKRNHDDIEINSPILRHPEDFETFDIVLDTLKKDISFTAEPKSAGVHVHVGFPEATPQELAALSQIFSAIEEQATNHFQMVSSRAYWNRPTDGELISYLEHISSNLVTIEKILESQSSRYRALNFHSLKKYGTVEFRFFNSTIEASQVKLFINFARGLVEATRKKDPRLVQFLLNNQDADHLELVDLAQALGMDIGSPEVFQQQIAPLQKVTHEIRVQAFASGTTGGSLSTEQPRLIRGGRLIYSQKIFEYSMMILWGQIIRSIIYQINSDTSDEKK